MGQRDRERIKDIKAGRRLPYRQEFEAKRETPQAVLRTIPDNVKLKALGLYSVRPKLPWEKGREKR